MRLAAWRWLGLAALGFAAALAGCGDGDPGFPLGSSDASADAPVDRPPDAPVAAQPETNPETARFGDLPGAADAPADKPADRAADRPSSPDALADAPMTSPPDLAPPMDLAMDRAAADTPTTVDVGYCDAAKLFSCMWMSTDTVNLGQTWYQSQDITIRGVVGYTMLSAGANWCGVAVGAGTDSTRTHSLQVNGDDGQDWAVQYYVQSASMPWRIGAAVEVRYQVTVAGDAAMPRRSMVLSSNGKVIVYVADAPTLEDMPPPPVELHRGPAAAAPCAAGRYDLLAGSGPAQVTVPYGQGAVVDGYWIMISDFVDPLVPFPHVSGQVGVGMLYQRPGDALDGGVDLGID